MSQTLNTLSAPGTTTPLRFAILTLALLSSPGCDPNADYVGRSVSRIDNFRHTQTDRVYVIKKSGMINDIQFTRDKVGGRVTGYSVYANAFVVQGLHLSSITFDGGTDSIRLPGTSAITDVRARTYGVEYTASATFPITSEQIRRIAEFDHVVVILSGEADLQRTQLGPKGMQALREFRDRFVEQDGIGDHVIRPGVQVSE